MHSLVLLLLVACHATLGFSRGYDSRDLIEREEPTKRDDGVLVECPVCEDTGHWMPSNEVCSKVIGNKAYKKCERGVYNNRICGNRPDCYRGPGEQCTEKHEFDMFGQKCAPGYYCNKYLGMCQGLDYVINTKAQYILNPTPYNFGGRAKGLAENAFIREN